MSFSSHTMKVCRVTYQDGSSETFRHDREGRETEHTDRNGTVTRTAHNLYGQPTGKTCTDRDGRRRVMGTWEYDSLYTGQQYDRETGQYYLRARYYNPVVGRFLQEDTYHGDGLNLYAYCANNPVVYYDPGGHDSAAVMKKAEEPDLPVGVGKGGLGASDIRNINGQRTRVCLKIFPAICTAMCRFTAFRPILTQI